MQTLADYQVLADSNFTLSGSNQSTDFTSRDFEVELPSNFVRGTNRAKPILSFVINPLQVIPNSFDGALFLSVQAGPENPNVTLVKNILFPQDDNFAFPPGGQRLVWMAIRGTRFRIGSNIIRLTIENPPQSRVEISDVVLWYQRRLS